MAEIVPWERRVKDLESTLVERFEKFRAIVPTSLKAERILRLMLSVVGRDAKLAQCKPDSIVRHMLTCAALGLEPDGTMGHAYPIPYDLKNQGLVCQTIIGYQGYVILAYRSGLIRDITEGVIRKGEKYRCREGTSAYIRHERNLSLVPQDGSPPSDIEAVYVCARLTNGGYKQRLMGIPEVEKYRAMGAGRNSDAWVKHYEPMALKTCWLRLRKFLPSSAEMQYAARLDDMAEIGEAQPEPEEIASVSVRVVDEKPAKPPTGPLAPAATTPVQPAKAASPAAAPAVKPKPAPAPATVAVAVAAKAPEPTREEPPGEETEPVESEEREF